MDAEVRRAAAGGFEVALFLNGELAYSRRCRTRKAALREAAAKRVELERAGWLLHW